MASPYAGVPVDGWRKVTEQLIAEHPLSLNDIRDAALVSWGRLWNTTVGDDKTGFRLQELDPPATVVGYFFEKIFSKELANRLPEVWIGGKGSQKDLHCITDESKSVEMKSSGQLGYRIFGNRSYGQKVENEDAAKKDKSGYYITINFFKHDLTLLRFGWIDADDWQAQKSATGQMAGLGEAVYTNKLIAIRGPYMLSGPIQLLPGVGAKAASELIQSGIDTIGEFIRRDIDKVPARFIGLQRTAKEMFADLIEETLASQQGRLL
jgi:hypothetical protein